MWEPLEMVTASRMQNMVQIREKKVRDQQFVRSFVLNFTFRVFCVESPRGGAIGIHCGMGSS